MSNPHLPSNPAHVVHKLPWGSTAAMSSLGFYTLPGKEVKEPATTLPTHGAFNPKTAALRLPGQAAAWGGTRWWPHAAQKVLGQVGSAPHALMTSMQSLDWWHWRPAQEMLPLEHPYKSPLLVDSLVASRLLGHTPTARHQWASMPWCLLPGCSLPQGLYLLFN